MKAKIQSAALSFKKIKYCSEKIVGKRTLTTAAKDNDR